METRIRDLLEELADGAPAPDPNATPPRLRRQARRRQAFNLAVAAVLVLDVVVLAILAGRALTSGSGPAETSPAAPGGSQRWTAVWPQFTRSQGRAAQAAADAGDPVSTWQRDARLVVADYATKALGWDFLAKAPQSQMLGLPNDLVDPDVWGPVKVQISPCAAKAGAFPKGCRVSVLVLERLLRHDRSGIWFITSVSSYTSEIQGGIQGDAVGQILAKFMALRMMGSPMVDLYLSPEARASYDAHVGGLSLFREEDQDGNVIEAYTDFNVLSVRQIDASSFQVEVRIFTEHGPDRTPGAFTETLTAGPGQNVHGDDVVLVVSTATLNG